ncbi:hypothetical protein B6D52_01385 [Candidatus Parcubacteria bacterium 4484_255]|nr:MAG: hypothetical protein B6D52_01385 [Candidatus Parcubacteria bacterium 4484_255]
MAKKLKILITGSSGTIGTPLFEKLLEKNYNIIGFDKNPNIWSKKIDKLTIIGNLLNKDDIKKIPTNIDIIIHLASNVRVYDSVLNPDLALENIIITYNILEFVRKNKIKKFIFSSTREVYGNKKNNMSKENDINIKLCESPYAASKISNEALIHAYNKCYNINYIIFRFSNIYGKYDISDRFIPVLIKKLKNNENVKIYGKNKLLDFTYVDDCIDGLIRGIKKFSQIKNNTFNIATGKGSKLIDIAKLIRQSLRSKSKIIIKLSRPGEVVQCIIDISKAKKSLEYQPKYSIQEGIKASIAWYSKKNKIKNRK